MRLTPVTDGKFAVAVFCGSRTGADPAHAAAAEEFGSAIGRMGWQLVYGGGDVGLMGVTARAAINAGADVTGIIPQRLLDREAGKHDLTELRVTATMFERKELLIESADAFVALPGGLGTLDEILDAVTLRQLGYHAKPILLVDLGGYWQSCQVVFEQFVAAGFADASSTRLYELLPDIGSTVRRLQAAARTLAA
ncbi:MAG: TIGR00730 family Rossman fold protein [Geminicoccaceae bacterium]